MGIYIPNMKSEQFYDLCKEHGLEIIAIPVPEHGRLIDAGYLYAGIETKLAKFVEEGRTAHSQQYEFGYWRGIEDAKSALTNTPTIIPAELSKEET